MRINFFARPVGSGLLDVTVLGSVAHVTVWTGEPAEASEQKYFLQFRDGVWPEGMEDVVKCDDAARVAIEHRLKLSGVSIEPVYLVCDHDTDRFIGTIQH
ncbi:hypothetical protein AB4Z32_27680, partial [Massilia sp. 2TAF26]